MTSSWTGCRLSTNPCPWAMRTLLRRKEFITVNNFILYIPIEIQISYLYNQGLHVYPINRHNYRNMHKTCNTLLFVCFIIKSILTYSFFSPTPALSTISKPFSSSMCSITPETANVGSSYNRMRGPGIGCWVSDRSNCSRKSLTLTFTLTSVHLSLYTYHSITFTGPYTTILTPTTVVQGVDNHSRGLYCRRCYCIRVCWGRSGRIFHTQVTHLPLGGVFYSP